MKKMKSLLIVLSLSFTAQAFALTDSDGVQCEAKVARLAKVYFNVVDTSAKLDYSVGKSDKIQVQSFKNVTPGSLSQEYIADVVIKFDKNRAYAPEQDQKVRFKLTGDYDCDALKVKNIKVLGGVERVD